jgi:hypothetical protein
VRSCTVSPFRCLKVPTSRALAAECLRPRAHPHSNAAERLRVTGPPEVWALVPSYNHDGMSLQQTKACSRTRTRHNWFEPSTRGMHARSDSRLSPRIFHTADSAPTICEPRRAKSRCSNTARGGGCPTPAYFLGCFRNLEHSAPHVIATPPPRVPRLTSDISCRGTYLHSWSHHYCRSLCDHNMGSFGQI